MPKNLPSSANRISAKQMREAIGKSGYLLEQRVEPILLEAGYYVEANSVFPDPQTGKSREIDLNAISATQIYEDEDHWIFSSLLCECENNAQPIVFFMKESPILSFMHAKEVKVSGIPVKLWSEKGYVSLSDFTVMKNFHHYCKGDIATQYCSFQSVREKTAKDKLSWVALHSDEQHNTFDSLVKSLEYEIAKHFDGWRLSSGKKQENASIQIYYPLVVLQGDLFCAYLENNHLTLKKSRHVQFRKEFFLASSNEVETYQIDVITEEYLSDYLDIIDTEVEEIKKIFQSKKENVLSSIAKILEMARGIKEKPKSYREYLEF
jgi:hypothetical protein